MLNISIFLLSMHCCSALHLNAVSSSSDSSDELLPSLQSIQSYSTPIVGLGLLVELTRRYFGRAGSMHLRRIIIGYLLVCVWRIAREQMKVRPAKMVGFTPATGSPGTVCQTCHGTGLAPSICDITQTKGYQFHYNDRTRRRVPPGECGKSDELEQCLFCPMSWQQAIDISSFRVGMGVRHNSKGGCPYRYKGEGSPPVWEDAENMAGLLGKVVRVDDYPEKGYAEVLLF